MGYYVQSYLTNANAIKQLYGSKDNYQLTTLFKKMADDLDELDTYFADEISNDKNAREVLKDITNGETRFSELAFMYGYVYEKLCKYYGKHILPPNDEYSTNYYCEIPKDVYKSFIPIPFSDDFPEMYSISIDELRLEKERFLALTTREGVDDEYLESEKKDFEFIFDKAIKENKDLVFFLY